MYATPLHGISQVSQNNGTYPSNVGNFPLEYEVSFFFPSALFKSVRAVKCNFF